MPTLTDEIKTFIVKGLACFDSPTQVADAVKANFDIRISRQHVYAYDPNASQRMSPRWRELHAATRAALLQETAEIGIVHKTVRLRMLDRMAHHAEARNYIELACAVLEQAAKECGGLYDRGKSASTPAVTSPLPSIRETPVTPS